MTIDPDRIKLRPATPEDADFVAEVSEIGMRAYVEQIGESWDFDLPRNRFLERWQAYRIVQIDGEDAGCTDVADEGEALRLNVLYLMPAFRNRGFGTFLLRQFIAQADAEQKPLRLRVIEVNPAKRLYERMGFQVTEHIPGRYFMVRPVGAS